MKYFYFREYNNQRRSHLVYNYHILLELYIHIYILVELYIHIYILLELYIHAIIFCLFNTVIHLPIAC